MINNQVPVHYVQSMVHWPLYAYEQGLNCLLTEMVLEQYPHSYQDEPVILGYSKTTINFSPV